MAGTELQAGVVPAAHQDEAAQRPSCALAMSRWGVRLVCFTAIKEHVLKAELNARRCPAAGQLKCLQWTVAARTKQGPRPLLGRALRQADEGDGLVKLG